MTRDLVRPNVIQPIPPLPPGLREAALRGTLVPFIGAGASKIAGCPDWATFADMALDFFIKQGKFSHGQLDQLRGQSPRVKLSIALSLQREHNLQIEFDKSLYNNGQDSNLKGRKLYQHLTNLGNTFVTTNYDQWLDTAISAPVPSPGAGKDPTTSAIGEQRRVFYKVDDLTPDNLRQGNAVFHLHGSIVDPDSMIMTTQHYLRHYATGHSSNRSTNANVVLSFLEFLFQSKTVLFVGYGLAELEILEYIIGKAHPMGAAGRTEIRHFLLQGFFLHEQELANRLSTYYAEFGIQLIPFLRDHKDWDQLIEVLDTYAQLAPVGPILKVQRLKEMEDLLNG